MPNPDDDAKGQYAPSPADRKASGVHSASPTVVTESEDATVHRDPPAREAGKNWDVNLSPAENNEGSPEGSR